jgi:hypothetical protein
MPSRNALGGGYGHARTEFIEARTVQLNAKRKANVKWKGVVGFEDGGGSNMTCGGEHLIKGGLIVRRPNTAQVGLSAWFAAPPTSPRLNFEIRSKQC